MGLCRLLTSPWAGGGSEGGGSGRVANSCRVLGYPLYDDERPDDGGAECRKEARPTPFGVPEYLQEYGYDVEAENAIGYFQMFLQKKASRS